MIAAAENGDGDSSAHSSWNRGDGGFDILNPNTIFSSSRCHLSTWSKIVASDKCDPCSVLQRDRWAFANGSVEGSFLLMSADRPRLQRNHLNQTSF